MKTYTTYLSLFLVFTVFICLPAKAVIPGSLSSSNFLYNPTNPPIIIDDRGKVCCRLPGPPPCMSEIFGQVSIYVEYRYELDTDITGLADYVYVNFDFTVTEPSGIPLQVYSPPGAIGNTFHMGFDFDDPVSNPWPPNAGLDLTGPDPVLYFQLVYTTATPVNYPIFDLIRTSVHVVEYKTGEEIIDQGSRSFMVKACPPQSAPPPGRRISSTEHLNPAPIKAYPNPFDNYLELSIESDEHTTPQIKLFDLKGRLISPDIRLKYAGNNQWKGSVSTKNLPPGVYVYNIELGDRTYRDKLIKL